MYELTELTPRSCYVQSPAKIGLFRLEGDGVCLIDSGNDKEAGRKLRQILEANGWKLKAIYNTHANADHIGGNRYLQSQTGCRIFVPGIDRAFTQYPVLEPAFLYGGFPPKALRHKLLMAQQSDAEELTADCLPDGLSLIPLPGHFFDMCGFRTEDGVVYLADCLSSKETLEKYQISFIYDVGAYLSTLETVAAMEARFFVPAHAEVTENIAPLAELNISKVREIAGRIIQFCAEPVIFEELLRRLFGNYGLSMSFEQYVLVGSTLRSYLSWLCDGGQLECFFEDNRMLWRARS